jgi:membrane protein DedA with SNARE-associated domain
VEGFLEHFGYAGILALLLAAGLGVPVPEEATQLAAGVLAHLGYLRVERAMATAWLGIVAGDAVFFFLARRAGPRVLASRAVARVLTPGRRARLERHFDRHAFATVFVGRHASGARLAVFALAGALGVRPRTFLAADALSAGISVPLVVGAGYLLSRHAASLERDVRLAELSIVAAIAAALLIAAALRRRRGRPEA